jgi:hypothetical protein
LFFFFLGNPAALRAATSPSANHLLALMSCTTLMICLAAMMGKLTMHRTQGQNESILLMRAISSAAALCGLVKIWLSSEELTWAPSLMASAAWDGTCSNRCGEIKGELNESR